MAKIHRSEGRLAIPEELDRALGFNLHRVSLLYRRELIRALAGAGLTPEQWQVLAVLWLRGGGLTQNQIASLTLRDKHAVSRMIARMERDGWIARDVDAHDSRCYRVEATSRARDQREEIVARVTSHFAPIRNALSASERDTLLHLLGKLRAQLEPAEVTMSEPKRPESGS